MMVLLKENILKNNNLISSKKWDKNGKELKGEESGEKGTFKG